MIRYLSLMVLLRFLACSLMSSPTSMRIWCTPYSMRFLVAITLSAVCSITCSFFDRVCTWRTEIVPLIRCNKCLRLCPEEQMSRVYVRRLCPEERLLHENAVPDEANARVAKFALLDKVIFALLDKDYG